MNRTFSGPAARREIDLMSTADAFEATPRQQAMARRRRRIKAPIGSRDHLRAGRSTERDHPRTCLQDGRGVRAVTLSQAPVLLRLRSQRSTPQQETNMNMRLD